MQVQKWRLFQTHNTKAKDMNYSDLKQKETQEIFKFGTVESIKSLNVLLDMI